MSNPEADGWIFMLIAHGNAPFVLDVAAGVIDNLTATGIYSLSIPKSIQLWYEKDANKKQLFVPNRYRIIGAMNNIDKNFVFDISQGLSRRFTFIEILPPEEGFFESEVDNAKKQAQKRVMEKVSNYGLMKIDEEFFNIINDNTTFSVAERDLRSFIRHIRYKREEDASFLGLELGTAQIIDAFETIYISLIMGGYDFSNMKKETVISIMDTVIASRIIPQIDGFDYIRLNEFYSAICKKTEFNGFVKAKEIIHRFIR